LSFYVQEADGCLGSKASARQAGSKKIWKLNFLTAPVGLLSKVGVLECREKEGTGKIFFLKIKNKKLPGREGGKEREKE